MIQRCEEREVILMSLNLSRALIGMQRIALFGVAILLLTANTACAASFDCDNLESRQDDLRRCRIVEARWKTRRSLFRNIKESSRPNE